MTDADRSGQTREHELAVARYIRAMDRGDLETVEAILLMALDDSELSRQLAEVDAALHAEVGLQPFKEQAQLVRMLLWRHLPSAFPDPIEPTSAISVGDVAARLQTDELTRRKLSASDRMINRQLLGSAVPLPSPATAPTIAKLAQQLGVSASERYWEVFRQAAVILAMARHCSQVELAAARRQARNRTGKRHPTMREESQSQ